MKKKKKFEMPSKMLVSVLIAVCLIIGIGVNASQGSLSDQIAKIAGTILGNSLVERVDTSNASFGYVGDSPTYLTDKRPGTLAPFDNIFVNDDFEVADDAYIGGNLQVDGTFAPTGTTTLPLNLINPISVALTQVATTTYASTTPAAAIRNAGVDKLCFPPTLFYKSGNGLFASNVSVGTTTCSTATASSCGTAIASYVATTTATLMASTAVASDVANTRYHPDMNGYAGTWYTSNPTSTVPWLWKTNEWLLAYDDHSSATSSASYTSAGGFTQLVGDMTVYCWNAY